MKILSVMLLVFGITASAFCEKEIEIPVVWRSSSRSVQAYETFALGFKETSENYYFVFQIRDLQKFLKSEGTLMVVGIDADNDPASGHFKGSGVDFQLNIILDRKTVSAMKWTDNKLETAYSYGAGEFTVLPVEDKLFLSLAKVFALKKVHISQQFTIFEQHSNGSKIIPGLLVKGQKIQKKDSFAKGSNFKMPVQKQETKSVNSVKEAKAGKTEEDEEEEEEEEE